MKNKKGILAIFVMLISVLACCFVFVENKISNVYAAETEKECFYLLSEDETPYEANVAVGKIDGLGKFTVGTPNTPFTATAYNNFQIVGWQVIFKDQNNRTMFIDAKNLVDNKKEVPLLAKDGVTQINANISFTTKENVFKSSEFSIEYVFENLVVRPVFDHVYYKVDIEDLINISTLENSLTIGEDILFYEETSSENGATLYSNSYINIGEGYYYYGDLYEENGEYYTLHSELTNAGGVQKINYTNGAFRVGDEINFNFNVNIDATDIKLSKNIDFVGAGVIGDNTTSLTKNTSNEAVPNSYKITQDEFLRTTNYELTFNIVADKNQKNVVDITYHDLYVVDLNILVDGRDSHNEYLDIFGETEVKSNEILSNISIYNFYSRTDENNLQFLIKKSQDNGAKAFGLICSNEIGKIVEGVNYKYYNFKSLDGETVLSKYYSNVAQNITISVEYNSTLYDVSFMSVEYFEDENENVTLGAFPGEVLETIALKRGENADLTLETAQHINNVGYKFIGYTTSQNVPVVENLSYQVDLNKPQSVLVYMCFEKIEYNIVFANYNKIKIGENTALNSINFTVINGASIESQTLNSADLVGENVSLNSKIKINGVISIVDVINDGFNVLGYSAKSPATVTADDYTNEFNFNEEFITANNIQDTLIIYVYEDLIKYTLTYYIDATLDNKLSQEVIMANINVETLASVEKFDIQGQLISQENNNLTALVAKIVVSNLKLNDEVVLNSEGFTIGAGEDEYSYVFNWFTEDNKSTLAYTKNNNTYSHVEVISRSRSIKVVYSMPSTKLLISVEEEFSLNQNFSYVYEISSNGTPLSPDEENGNVYTIAVGLTLSISISEVAFGYNFVGYTHVEESAHVDVDTLTFEYVTKVGINTLELDFERVQYQFIFSQYGANYNGELITFAGKNYASLDVDNTSLEIEKPLGYYVSQVLFADTFADYSNKISETNDYRSSANIQIYYFALDREDFINLVTNYGTPNGQNITEVKVRLNYTIFTYNVQVNYGITNPKGSGRDAYVVYPKIALTYEFEGKTNTALIDTTTDVTTLLFYNIPYGSKATMTLTESVTAGFSLSGWIDADGGRILQEDFKHSLEYLIIENLIQDKEFGYNLTYNAYHVNVVYVSGQGTPKTSINNIEVTANTKQITLFDKLDIVANATRANGYVFDKITYKTPVYTQYVFSQESWDLKFASLYILKNGTYHLNTSNVYNENDKYFVFSEGTAVCETDLFTDESFSVADYVLDEDGKTITFVVEYKLLELKIINKIIEKVPPKTSKWSLTSGRGATGAKLTFELNSLAVFSISAQDREANVRDILENDTVNFYDTVTVNVEINKQALNLSDENNYDLSLGLTLNSVYFASTVGNAPLYPTTVATGEYTFTFYVGEFISYFITDEINITYELLISPKHVNVTTIVKTSTTFYENVRLFIDAATFSFDRGAVSSVNGASSVDHDLQFLAKAKIYASFITDNYKNNFVVSGVKVYCDGAQILPEEYAEYGITLNEDNSINAKMFRDMEVVFIVQPKITYNDGPVYTKTFICDELGNGQAQKLSVGNTNADDIQVDEMLMNSISLKYVSTEPNSLVVDSVKNVGRYNVILSFENTAELDWLSEITVAENVMLIIQPKELTLTYDVENIVAVSKVYDGTSNYNVSNVYKYLIFTDGANINIKYEDILANGGNNLVLNSTTCYIATAGKDSGVTTANENLYYNLYVYGYSLKNNQFNNNFVLKNSDLVIYNYIKITKREIKLHNVYIYNKVYDGTDKAELVSTENITISNTISGDDVSINISRLNPRFNDITVGTNKTVMIDATSALVGQDVSNYYVKGIETQGLTIYPYSLSTTIKGLGTVEILNKRGLTEKDKVDLIPLNAALDVNPIYVETQEYISIYSRISKHLKGNNEYAIGYEISFMVNGENVPVNNDLYLSIPTVKNLTGTYFLTGQQTGAVQYENENGNMLIDLSQIGENVSHVFLTRTKILLKPWQIALIIVGIVLLITVVVLFLIVVRKRKQGRDSVHEKI